MEGAEVVEEAVDAVRESVAARLKQAGALALDDELLVAQRTQGQPREKNGGEEDGNEENEDDALHATGRRSG